MRLPRTRRRVGLAALALAVLAPAVLAPAAGALTSRFTVNDGAEYARSSRVGVGDGGYSAFFRPGVVVWDGGSIIAGHGAATEYKLPVLSLTMVPRECASYVSSSPGAKIAAMLADAPDEVDAHYGPNRDLNVCVMQAGGSDLRAGRSASDIYAAVRQYCEERRAVGFVVLVLTLLPTDDGAVFEAGRLAYNTMLRDTWAEFCDGLVDVAADARIGDAGDNYDRQFYKSDALHPNSAGNVVMASVAAPVLCGLPWKSADCEMRLRDGDGDWGDWLPYAADKTLALDDVDGEHTVSAQYRLDGETVEVSDSIFVDTVRPVPMALRAVKVRSGGTAKLRFRIKDAVPCGPTVRAFITVTTNSGRVLKSFSRRNVAVGKAMYVKFKCRLPRGTYRYVVKARDAAGNPQKAASSARLVVR